VLIALGKQGDKELKSRVILFDILTGGHHIKNVSYLAQYLLERGYEVMFVTAVWDERVEALAKRFPQLEIETFLPNSANDIARAPFLKMLRLLWEGLTYCYKRAVCWKANVILLLYLDHAEVTVLLRTLLWRKRCWSSYGFLIWPYPENEKIRRAPIYKRFYWRFRRWALKKMLRMDLLNAIFVHTEAARQSVLGKAEVKELQDRVVIVPDPCEPLEEPVTKQEARSRLCLPQNKTLLLFFGRLRWDKGIDILLKAVKECDEDFTLVVAGQPGYIGNAEIEALKSELKGSCEIISRLQYIEPSEEKLYFYAADAVVLPYRRAFRGTSGILQNAAAARRPVIVTDVGLIGEIVRKYSLGIVVEPESTDALMKGIKEFLGRRSEIEKEVEGSAASYAERHHWRKMCSLVEKTFMQKG